MSTTNEVVSYNFAITKDFSSQLFALDTKIFQKWQRVGELLFKNPFHNSLRSHPIVGSRNKDSLMYSAELDDNFRIIFQQVKPSTIVLLWVDSHDAAYRKANRLNLTIKNGQIKVIDVMEEIRSSFVSDNPRYENRVKGKLDRSLFAAFADPQLLETGLDKEGLARIKLLDSWDDFEKIEAQISTPVFDKLFNLLDAPPLADSDQIQTALASAASQGDVLPIDAETYKKVLDGTFSDWMLFLHPAQRQLVESNFNGPAKVRGSAGTGKTAVGLHRARFLARSLSESILDKVLFLCYNKSLASILGDLLAGFCSPKELERVEVRTLHSWCARFLQRNGIKNEILESIQVKLEIIELARLELLAQYPNSKLLNGKLNQFLLDEISYSIKGRNISALEDYLQLKRTGRGTPLNSDERKVAFGIYEHYQKLLGDRCDWDDLVLRTLELLQKGIYPGASYKTVIVDEMQDLSEAAMKLIAELAGNQQNGLLMLGDGQQKIYRGGYSLSRLGISVVGRSRILKENYRNTREIYLAANSLLKQSAADDPEDDDESISDKSDTNTPRRSGPKPVFKDFQSIADEVKWVSDSVKELIASDRQITAKDIVILYLSPNRYLNNLTRSHFKTP